MSTLDEYRAELVGGSTKDHEWFLEATASITNHARMLDRQAVSIMKLRTDAAEAVSQTQAAVAQVGASHEQHQAAIELLEQVVALHPHASRVHIGCDEPTLSAATAALPRAASAATGSFARSTRPPRKPCG